MIGESNIAKPDQITHLWKGWILRKSWTCVFHCPAFLGQSFLVKVSNLIRLRNNTHPGLLDCLSSLRSRIKSLAKARNVYPRKTPWSRTVRNILCTISITKPDQIIHFLKKLVDSKSSAKPDSWKSSLSNFMQRPFPTARFRGTFERSGFAKLDAHFNTVQLFELSSFFKKWIIWSGFAICNILWYRYHKHFMVPLP